jgi:hypothetical protein
MIKTIQYGWGKGQLKQLPPKVNGFIGYRDRGETTALHNWAVIEPNNEL